MAVHDDGASRWDVFVSYSRSDSARAEPLLAALREQDLRVFVDDSAVDDFTSITAAITEALAHSKTLLAVYSADYPRRRACQWELTYAYLAGQREGDPRRRVMVVNPEKGTGHVHPVELRDARHWPWPQNEGQLASLTERVAARSAALHSPMGAVAEPAPAPWLPAPAHTSSARFTGRLAEQWRIHTALHRHRAPLTERAGTGRSAQLVGMPGIGKSLLAQEYALRFGPAFPGGVFWFDLQDDQHAAPDDVLGTYAEQVSTVMAALGLDPAAGSLPERLSRLAVKLVERGAHCLWVVDGIPDGLSSRQLHLLRGPHLLAATLMTARSPHYADAAETITVPPLADPDALLLLTSERVPDSPSERNAATALVRDVGGHPQALRILADLAKDTPFNHLRNRLHAPGKDILTASTPRSKAATHHSGRRLLTAELLPKPLNDHGPVDDILRLMALACPAPLTESVLDSVLAAVEPYDPWETPAQVAEAVETLQGAGTLQADPTQEHNWLMHPLLARVIRRHDADSARQEDLRRVLVLRVATAPATEPTLSCDPSDAYAAAASVRPSAARSPGRFERAAAFDLQVELVTRIGVQPLAYGEGSLREALTSLHSLFATTREVLHRMAAEAAAPATLPTTAAVLLSHLRPFLATWHPALQQHEAARPAPISAAEHERQWERGAEMRSQLADLRAPLTSVAKELAELCGVDLLPTTPTHPG